MKQDQELRYNVSYRVLASIENDIYHDYGYHDDNTNFNS